MDSFLSTVAPFQGLALALVLGFLIGIERGWARREAPDGSRVAGIRTFALLGLVGGIAGKLGQEMSVLVGTVILAFAGVALLMGYARGMQRQDDISATTTVVGIITLGLGVFAATGQGVLASVVAATMMLVLSSRRQLHHWLEHMNEAEIQAIVRFTLISLAILPLLPDQAYGPYDAWNPRQLWMVVILVSGISLVGYAVSKRFGTSRGILATATAGAIVSSTAVTASLAARLGKNEGTESILIIGIIAASTVMFFRVLVLVSILVPAALRSLTILLGPAILFSVGYIAWLLYWAKKNGEKKPDQVPLRNPFDVRPALILLGLVMGLSVAARWMLDHFGDAALAIVLSISGMLDVDSAIITMGGLPSDALDAKTAGLVLAAPVMVNTLAKAGVAVSMAGLSAGRKAALPLLLSIVAGLMGLPFLI